MMNANRADFRILMAAEMPVIVVGHAVSPITGGKLGEEAGEDETVGAAAAVTNAVDDALTPFGVTIIEIPLTPEILLRALGRN